MPEEWPEKAGGVALWDMPGRWSIHIAPEFRPRRKRREAGQALGLDVMEWMDFPSRGGEGSVWGLAVWVSVTRQPARRIQVEMPSRGSIHACRAIWAASTNKTGQGIHRDFSMLCGDPVCGDPVCGGSDPPHPFPERVRCPGVQLYVPPFRASMPLAVHR